MKLNHFVVLPLFLLLSCNPKGNEALSLFNNICFQLEEGDVNAQIDLRVKNDYFATANHENDYTPPPLYRYISNKNYRIYIGMPFQVSFETLSKLNALGQPVKEIRDTNCAYKIYRTSETYFVEYVIEINKSLLYVLATTDSKQILDSKLSYSQIKKRIYLD